jgi:intracellular multiplication protein IcmT
VARAEDDTVMERENWHWRNSMRPARFFNLDARAALPFFILLFYFRPITLVLTAMVTGFFYFLERRGLTFPSSIRAGRVWIIGSERPAWLSIRRRRYRDFG